MTSDTLMKIYNQLLALRENLPQEKHISRKYVDHYNSLVSQLEVENNYSLSDFKVPESVLEYTSGISRRSGFEGFGEKKCERGLLLMKLDAILLQFRSNEEKPQMGFLPPKK
ncbi:MAG: hypothetical protein HYW15_03285 [Candidatus Giovannonibacteria bacterium]|nr:MAG: hypothetical protein HYW15_03285 [Candidatus Giovannonibacteria bacterium]